MKSTRLSIFLCLLLGNLSLLAQDIEKMNKSELRGFVASLVSKQDSLQTLCISLEASKKSLIEKLNSSDLKNKANDAEVARLISLIEKNRIETERLNEVHQKLVTELENAKSSYEKTVGQLNATITSLKDSLTSYQSLSSIQTEGAISDYDTAMAVSRSGFKKDDFLNQYYVNQFPLTNHSFQLVLTKLIYGDVSVDDDQNEYSRDDNENKGGVISLPETLDVNKFTFWGIQPNKDISGEGSINSYVFSRTGAYLDAKLPTIEVLKNKLFTLKYPNGKEESFLFNIKQTENTYNNHRKVLQIELANEDVKEDGTNSTAKDIVWRVYSIENECYLALSISQLDRLNLKLRSVSRRSVNGWDDSSYYTDTTTGEEIYISRNKDQFMAGARYVKPWELIYLFKLK